MLSRINWIKKYFEPTNQYLSKVEGSFTHMSLDIVGPC